MDMISELWSSKAKLHCRSFAEGHFRALGCCCWSLRIFFALKKSSRKNEAGISSLRRLNLAWPGNYSECKKTSQRRCDILSSQNLFQWSILYWSKRYCIYVLSSSLRFPICYLTNLSNRDFLRLKRSFGSHKFGFMAAGRAVKYILIYKLHSIYPSR